MLIDQFVRSLFESKNYLDTWLKGDLNDWEIFIK